ncbi:hypothetical protein AAAD23_005283 [Escherichia coli]
MSRGEWKGIWWMVERSPGAVGPLENKGAEVACSVDVDRDRAFTSIDVRWQDRTYKGNPDVIVLGPGGRDEYVGWRYLPDGMVWHPRVGSDERASAVADGSAVFSYADSVRLERVGASVRIIYGIESTSTLAVHLSGVPDGLECVRESDTMGVSGGVDVVLKGGDGVKCTNKMRRLGRVEGNITVTAMIK